MRPNSERDTNGSGLSLLIPKLISVSTLSDQQGIMDENKFPKKFKNGLPKEPTDDVQEEYATAVVLEDYQLRGME